VTGTYIKARQMEVRAAFNTYIGEQTPEPTVPVLPRRLIAV